MHRVRDVELAGDVRADLGDVEIGDGVLGFGVEGVGDRGYPRGSNRTNGIFRPTAR